MVLGDFDLSGIGTVTHVEGSRVYGFGHPMFGRALRLATDDRLYSHRLPPGERELKMGSPLKVVGVLDTDVSTCVAGRVGPVPDMLPMTVRVKTSHYADSRQYHVQIIREPTMLPALLMSVLTSAIDTEGNLPEELTAHLSARFRLKGQEAITLVDTFSGPRYTGPMGAMALFSPLASIANLLVKNPMGPVRIEGIDCEVEIEPGRKVATIETARLLSDTVQPGKDLKAIVTLKPFKGERETVEYRPPCRPTFPKESIEAISPTRWIGTPPVPQRADAVGPARPERLHETIRAQTEVKRTAIYVHIPTPEARGLAVQGQELLNLPGSVRAAFASKRKIPALAIHSDLITVSPCPWVVEGTQTIRFTVAKDAGLSLSLSP